MWRWKLTRRANICRNNMTKEWESMVCWICTGCLVLTIFISAWWLTVAFSLAFTRLKYFPEAQISPLPFSLHGVENLIHCTGETALAMVMASHSSPGRQIIELSNVFPNLQRNIFYYASVLQPPPPLPTLPPVEFFCRIGQIIAAKPVSKYAEKVELLTLRLHSRDRYWDFMTWTRIEVGSPCLSLSMIFTMTKSGSVSHNSS